MSNSINTNIAAYYAQANITSASTAASASVARLSSGNRIVQASDDVAALATGTSLLTTVSALRSAQTNASQGTSLLQVADGALAQIQNILQQQKSIALQAGSGSLTNVDRGFLNQQFQALTQEIDSLSGSTTFNGVNLLDGSLSQAASVANNTTQANSSAATITLSSNAVDGDAIVIDGITLTARNAPSASGDFQIGATTADTVSNLATKLNALGIGANSQTLGQATYSAQGSTLSITSRTGGVLGDNFTINVTGVANNKAGVGGQYGGSTVNMFTTDFTSATNSVVGVSSAITTPFQNGNTITATVGAGTAQTLYTVATGNSLTDIVNGINTNTITTGIHASLVFNTSAQTYNIQLHTNNSTGAISINGGANFYNATDRTAVLNGSSSTTNLFTSDFASGLGGTISTAGSVSAASPFKSGDHLKVSVAGGALVDITGALGAAETLATLVTKINASAGAATLGLHAAVSGSNIALTYNDPTTTNQIAFNGGTNFFNTDAYGSNLNNGLNSAFSSINLFKSGFASSGTLVTAAASSATAPFQVADVLGVTIPGVNGGAAITLSTITAGQTLQQVAGSINASAGALANGIHAQVVEQADGTYNLKLNVATSTAPATITFTGGTNFFDPTSLTAATGVTQNGVNVTNNATYALLNAQDSSAIPNATTSVVTAGAATAATPFVNANHIYAKIGAAAAVDISGALATGNTLTVIVAAIHANAVTTNIDAALDATGKNILLTYTGSGSPTISFGLNATPAIGTNSGPATNTDASGTQATNGLGDSYSYVNLLGTGIAVGSSNVVIHTATTSTASKPFGDASSTGGATVIKANINGAGALSLYTVAATDNSLLDIANGINASAVSLANNVHASVIIDNAGKQNILLTQADTTNAGAAATFAITVSGEATGFTAGTYAATNYYNNLALASTHATVALGTDTATHLATFGLAGGENNGLGFGNTSVTGTVGDSLVTGLAQNAAKVSVSFPDVDPSALTSVGNFGSAGNVYLTVAGHNFAFVSAANTPDQITIGSTLQATLDNAVSTINSYLNSGNANGNTAYLLNQINVAREGNNLVFTGKGISDVTQIDGTAAPAIGITGFTNGAPVSNGGLLNNASRHSTGTFGVDTTGLSNPDFTGTINGFTATYSGTANTVNLSTKVGNYTYTANNVNTSPTTGNETIRFFSNTLGDGTNGGYFDVQLAQNKGQSVNSTSDANTYAQRINAAFNSLSFAQERQVSSYNGTQSITAGGQSIGSLIGSSVSAQLPSFSANKLTAVTVTAPTTGNPDAQIALTIDGVQYQTKAGLGSQLGANQTYRLVSTVNPNNFLDFTTGNTAIQLGTSADATAVAAAVSAAFGTNTNAAALSFQVGASVSDTLGVSLGSAKTASLFNGRVLDVSSQTDAAAAGAFLDTAINTITALRSTVGALESRFNFVSAALQTSVQNQDAARGQLLDTDIATESTAYATSQVKLQAGISVLAQANQSLQALLKLIG